MKMINVVTTLHGRNISQENQNKIRAVNPDVNLQDATLFLSEELNGNLSHAKELDNMLGEADVIFARVLPENVIKRAPKLKWIQMSYAGIETVLKDKDLVDSPVTLTNASGVQAEAISEFVLAMMLAFDKRLLKLVEQKNQKIWKSMLMVGLASQTVGILGLGSIGKELARKAKALGMHVIAYDRPRKSMRARYVDQLVAGEEIDLVFKQSDFVACCLPLAPKTTGIIGAKEFRLMKPTAVFINVSRGPVVQEDALIRALQEKWIAGAGLDVFEKEPLPQDSPLWEMPNVIISPHCCGRLDDNDDRVVEFFVMNLKRYLNGKHLLNIVDKKAGF
jgi:phosphoglycerate dehydrogenase-like enzyme